jgi:fructose-bisphosphate aldolase class 1
VEAQLLKIMYGEESMARERKKEGRAVGHKRKKRSHLRDQKYRKWHAKAKVMAGAPANSERDEEAQVLEECENNPAQI